MEKWEPLRIRRFESYTAERYLVSSKGRLATYNARGGKKAKRAKVMQPRIIRGEPHYQVTLPVGRFDIPSSLLITGDFTPNVGQFLAG